MARLLILAVCACSTSALAGPQPRAVPYALADPAVFSFTDFVTHRMKPPLSNGTVLTGLDLLISALEGVAIAQQLDDDLLEDAHELRREARVLYDPEGGAADTDDRRELLTDVAELIEELNRRLPQDQRIAKARLEAIDRAARSLDVESPLPKQPDVVERFFRHAAAALRVAQP